MLTCLAKRDPKSFRAPRACVFSRGFLTPVRGVPPKSRDQHNNNSNNKTPATTTQTTTTATATTTTTQQQQSCAHAWGSFDNRDWCKKKLMANLPTMETILVLGIPLEFVLFGFVFVLFCFPILLVLKCSWKCFCALTFSSGQQQQHWNIGIHCTANCVPLGIWRKIWGWSWHFVKYPSWNTLAINTCNVCLITWMLLNFLSQSCLINICESIYKEHIIFMAELLYTE